MTDVYFLLKNFYFQEQLFQPQTQCLYWGKDDMQTYPVGHPRGASVIGCLPRPILDWQ